MLVSGRLWLQVNQETGVRMKALQGSFFAASRTLHGDVTPKRIGFFIDMVVSKNNGTPKSSILIVFSIINHPFWGIPNFGNTHIFPWEIPTSICCGKIDHCHPSLLSSSFARVTSTIFFSRCTLKVTLEHCFGLLKCQQIPEKNDMAPVSNVLLYDPPVTKLSNLTSGPTSFSASTSTKHWSLQLW